MASGQEQKQDPKVEEMIKEAKLTMEKGIKDGTIIIQPQLPLVGGAIFNRADRPMKLKTGHQWSLSGKYLLKPSETIQIGWPGSFVHQGEFSFKGSKAAVVYTEYLRDGEDAHVGFIHAWLLAWHVNPFSKLPITNKVYVEAGWEGMFEKINWDEIEKKLDNSRDISYSYDPASKAIAYAKIDRNGDQAHLGAVFTEHMPRN